MKNLLVIIVLSLIFSNSSFAGDCSGCASEAYDAYRDARKAYRANSLSVCQRYAKKAYRHLSYAESEASDCGCSDAEDEAYYGSRDAKKAYRANSLRNCQRYAKKSLSTRKLYRGLCKLM